MKLVFLRLLNWFLLNDEIVYKRCSNDIVAGVLPTGMALRTGDSGDGRIRANANSCRCSVTTE